MARPRNIETYRRRLAKARDDLAWALHLPHPYPGRQRQRLRTLEWTITRLMEMIQVLEKEQKP